MPKLIDLTGRKFGKLTVVERAGSNRHKHVLWLCQCECGKTKAYSAGQLKDGKATSCNCAWKFKKGEAAFNMVLRNYKKRAERLGVPFELTSEQFKRITQESCYYCLSEPNNICSRENYNGDFCYNGVDRLDNDDGYVTGNVVPCCKYCNYAKSNRTLAEFVEWVLRVAERCKNETILGN